MTRRLMTAGLIGIAMATVAGAVAAAGKPANEYLVTTTIADSANGYGLRVGSDTQGAYVTTGSRRQQTVSSKIVRYQNGTDWWVTTYYGSHLSPSNRALFFDLSEPVTMNPAPPMTSGYVQAHLIAKCSLVNVDMITMAAGASVECPGAFRFQAPDQSWWRFSFQPEKFAGVDRMRVTCSATDSVGCKLWTVTPSSSVVTQSDPNPKNRNKLLLLDGSSEEVLAEYGDYYLSFSITIAR